MFRQKGGGKLKLTQTERAFKLGISQNFFSLIYNGQRRPSYKTVERWNREGIIRNKFMWWRETTLTQIQRVLDAIK